MWVYFAGERSGGESIKIGSTKQRTVAQRLKGITSEVSIVNEGYVLLAAVRGDAGNETTAQRYFAHCRLEFGNRQEYFTAAPELIEYVLWLRAQHYVCVDPYEPEESYPREDPNYWLPQAERRVARQPDDPGLLFQRHVQLQGALSGTAWAWMPDPLASYKDYFTPPHIVERAWQAMGGIDLDAASHFLANKRLVGAGIRIGDYFTRSHDAFTHDWHGRVWLNPPYGNYEPWFERIAEQMALGRVQQVCMISPMWAFGTKLAQPHMARSSALIVLSPTPEFFNPGDPTRTGRNDPHAVVYWGPAPGRFLESFADLGIACRVERFV
jgi:hypothetical protein